MLSREEKPFRGAGRWSERGRGSSRCDRSCFSARPSGSGGRSYPYECGVTACCCCEGGCVWGRGGSSGREKVWSVVIEPGILGPRCYLLSRRCCGLPHRVLLMQVLKTKLTRLEDESNTQSLAAETSPSKATTLAVPVVTQTQRPVIVSTTPALIEFELVPVTNSGRGKGGVEAGSDDVRLKTVVNSEVGGRGQEAGTGGGDGDTLEPSTTKGGGGGVGEVRAEAEGDVSSSNIGIVVGATTTRAEMTRTVGRAAGMETTPTTSGTSKGQRTRAEDMAEIVKRLEKLEAEVASKTQTRR